LYIDEKSNISNTRYDNHRACSNGIMILNGCQTPFIFNNFTVIVF